MTGHLAAIYSRRHDMIRMLRSAKAPGRPYLLLATDELLPANFNFNNAPLHIVGLRTQSAKLATYSTWTPRTGKIEPETMELEFYDYGTPEGAAEMVSDPDDRRARVMLNMLLKNLIPNELPGAAAGCSRSGAGALQESVPLCGGAGSGSELRRIRARSAPQPWIRARILGNRHAVTGAFTARFARARRHEPDRRHHFRRKMPSAVLGSIKHQTGIAERSWSGSLWAPIKRIPAEMDRRRPRCQGSCGIPSPDFCTKNRCIGGLIMEKCFCNKDLTR